MSDIEITFTKGEWILIWAAIEINVDMCPPLGDMLTPIVEKIKDILKKEG